LPWFRIVRWLWLSSAEARLAEHRGRLVKLMGDGLIAVFGSVGDAVAYAAAVSKQVPAWRRCHPSAGSSCRTVVLTTQRFLAVPFLVGRAPVAVIMHARIARLFAAELGLSLSSPPVELQDIAVSLLWRAPYDRDPAHAWLRQIVARLVAEL
jgi:hypothetical protein